MKSKVKPKHIECQTDELLELRKNQSYTIDTQTLIETKSSEVGATITM